MEAELRGADGQPVHSVREFVIKDQPASLTEPCTATASSVYQPAYLAEYAVDGDESSYWSSAFQDDAWLAVDLGAAKRVGRVVIVWENAYAKAFTVELSADGTSWKEIHRTADGKGGTTNITFDPDRSPACPRESAPSAARNGATPSVNSRCIEEIL